MGGVREEERVRLPLPRLRRMKYGAFKEVKANLKRVSNAMQILYRSGKLPRGEFVCRQMGNGNTLILRYDPKTRGRRKPYCRKAVEKSAGEAIPSEGASDGVQRVQTVRAPAEDAP
jgi:hypothetical protein